MRRIIVAGILTALFSNGFSQKAAVQLSRSHSSSTTGWQILDAGMYPVAASADFGSADSVSLGLEENRRYYLQISVPATAPEGSVSYTLYINSEAVMHPATELIPGDHFFTFFTGVKEPASKITGGTGVSISEYPWQVFFEAGNYTCGGSIISNNWIITAAHCTQDDSGRDIPASSMDVIVGADDPRTNLDGRRYYVSKVIRHENYDNNTFDNDIALLQLSQNINYPNAVPIRLVSKIDAAAGTTAPGVMAWVTGYGLTQPVPPVYPETLQAVQIPIVSTAQAATIWTGYIPPTDLMAGYKTGNKDACNGDSGGPLVVPVEGVYKLAGLVSWGSSNCNTYGAYTRVSDFETWINSKTGIEISYVPPVPAGDSIICPGTGSSVYGIGAVDGVTAWEWQLSPAEAGTVAGNNSQAGITWKNGYRGAATLKLRVTRYGIVSYWSALTIHLAADNSLAGVPSDTVICAGEPVTFNIDADGYNLGYAWFRNDTLLQEGSSSSYRIPRSVNGNNGLYRCDVTGSCGEKLSPEADLTVLPVTVIKTISPDSRAGFGDNLDLLVDAAGHDLNYQWQMDDSELPGATARTYPLLNVNASNTGLYKVDVKGSCGEVLSRGVYVYVTDKASSNDPLLEVWPTIVSAELNVAIESEDEYSIRIFSASGRLIISRDHCSYRTSLDLSDFAGGLYLVRVTAPGFTRTIKLIKS